MCVVQHQMITTIDERERHETIIEPDSYYDQALALKTCIINLPVKLAEPLSHLTHNRASCTLPNDAITCCSNCYEGDSVLHQDWRKVSDSQLNGCVEGIVGRHQLYGQAPSSCHDGSGTAVWG